MLSSIHILTEVVLTRRMVMSPVSELHNLHRASRVSHDTEVDFFHPSSIVHLDHATHKAIYPAGYMSALRAKSPKRLPSTSSEISVSIYDCSPYIVSLVSTVLGVLCNG